MGVESSGQAGSIEAALRGLPDVVTLDGARGQVLLYPGHVPTGLYAVLSGAVTLAAREGEAAGELASAAEGPFVVPPPDELQAAAPRGVTVTEPARLLFIPRRLAVDSEAISAILRGCRVATRSLKKRTE